MASYAWAFFSQSVTTLAVHTQLRKLLVCEYLKKDELKERFILNCRTDLPPSMIHEEKIVKILDFLESVGKFSEGNYTFIKEKTADVHVDITEVIELAEERIKYIRENSLKIETSVTEVEPVDIEEETRSRVNVLLLSVSEFLICKSKDQNTKIDGLWERYIDLQTLSYHFLSLWHTEYCRCQKRFGQQMLLQFIEFGAAELKSGLNEYDFFRYNLVPSLWLTLNESVKCTCNILKEYGASPVSVARSSVLSYWIFDSVTNLDKLWTKYEEGGLHVDLQNCLNSEETLRLLKIDRISLKITIQKSDYLKYRNILEKNVPGVDRLQTLDLSTVKSPVETTAVGTVKATIKTTEGDSIVDSTEALKLDHAKRTDKTTETEYSKLFEKSEASLKDPSSDPDIAQVKRGKLPIYSDLMEKRLYEINQRLSETPTVLSYLLHSGDKMKREQLYASVSLLEYDHVRNVLHSRHSTKIENIPDRIFCTSDEDLWKGRLSSISKKRHRKPYEANSTCVFILGEAGCGKTSYCLHLLRQWCQGEELQKFYKVFYVDTSVLKTSMTSISNILSSFDYGNLTFSKNKVDRVLKNEKCLILIDGDEYFRGSSYQIYEIQESVMEYCNCVFVFLIRPSHFMSSKSFSHFESWEANCRFIQLLGLDEKGMASLYSNVMVQRYEIRQSEPLHEIMTADSKQQIMKKSTLQKEKTEPDTVLFVTESYPFESKKGSNSQVYITQNPSESERLVKKSGIGDFAKEADSMPKTEKYISEHGREELEFYKIKGVLENILCENYDSIMKIPMFGSVCVELLAEGKDLPRNFTNLYLCLVDKLVGGHKPQLGGKGEKTTKPYDLFLRYESVHRHVETLRKLGNIAYNSLFSPASQLLNYKDLDMYLEEKEIMFSIKTGLLVLIRTSKYEESNKSLVRFLHKSIQDTLVSIHLVTEKEEAIDSFCQQLTSMDVIIDVSHVIMMICGLNPILGCRLSRSIKNVLDKDENVIRHRQDPLRHSFVKVLYYLQLSWYSEYKDKVTSIGSNTTGSFYVSDIYVDGTNNKETRTRTIAILSDKNVIVTSLCIDDVPAENSLSDKVLNEFLAYNTSLESMYIVGGKTYRSIEPLSFPSLTVLRLRYVHIQPASSDDDTTKPLLYHLPMLERLSLFDIQLRKRLLGLTQVEGKMPKLKTVHIENIDMDDQSIELSPDMTDIKEITLHNFKMTPQGWMTFIQSLFNIHHPYDVNLIYTDIDAKSQEMVRTNESFVVKYESNNIFQFRRA